MKEECKGNFLKGVCEHLTYRAGGCLVQQHFRMLNSGSPLEGSSDHGEPNVLCRSSAKLKLSPSVVRSIPSACDARSGSLNLHHAQQTKQTEWVRGRLRCLQRFRALFPRRLVDS